MLPVPPKDEDLVDDRFWLIGFEYTVRLMRLQPLATDGTVGGCWLISTSLLYASRGEIDLSEIDSLDEANDRRAGLNSTRTRVRR
jgi:hypothetical protein